MWPKLYQQQHKNEESTKDQEIVSFFCRCDKYNLVRSICKRDEKRTEKTTARWSDFNEFEMGLHKSLHSKIDSSAATEKEKDWDEDEVRNEWDRCSGWNGNNFYWNVSIEIEMSLLRMGIADKEWLNEVTQFMTMACARQCHCIFGGVFAISNITYKSLYVRWIYMCHTWQFVQPVLAPCARSENGTKKQFTWANFQNERHNRFVNASRIRCVICLQFEMSSILWKYCLAIWNACDNALNIEEQTFLTLQKHCNHPLPPILPLNQWCHRNVE